MNPIDLFLATALLALGGFQLYAAYRSLDAARRVQRIPTTPIADVKEGPAEVSGTIRAASDETLETLGGVRAVAIKTIMSFAYKRGSKTYSTLPTHEGTVAVRVELADASGTCAIDLDDMIVLGEVQQWSFTASQLEEKHPDMWRRCEQKMPGSIIVRVAIEQTWIPEGATALVSGHAESGEAEDSDDYRGGHRRFRMRASGSDPLIVSSWAEGALKKELSAPARVLGWMGGVCVACGTVVLLLARAVAKASGH